MAQDMDMQPPLPEQVRIHFPDMPVHLRELHARIRPEHTVNRHPFLYHHEEHCRTVLPAG
jgi:hypothetical protein